MKRWSDPGPAGPLNILQARVLGHRIQDVRDPFVPQRRNPEMRHMDTQEPCCIPPDYLRDVQVHHEVLNFVTHLAEEGVAAYGHNHLSHGGTSEMKEFIAKEDGMLARLDMTKVNARMREALPEILRIVIEHSMDFFVTKRILALHGDDIDGIIVIGTSH